MDAEQQAPESGCLKVSSKSSPASVAGAIAGMVKDGVGVEIQAVGAGAVNQAVKAEFDEEKTVEAVAEIAVQINGKMRGTIKIAKDADKETAIAAAKEAVADKLTGNIVKEIYVPGRIVNIVQK